MSFGEKIGSCGLINVYYFNRDNHVPQQGQNDKKRKYSLRREKHPPIGHNLNERNIKRKKQSMGVSRMTK